MLRTANKKRQGSAAHPWGSLPPQSGLVHIGCRDLEGSDSIKEGFHFEHPKSWSHGKDASLGGGM